MKGNSPELGEQGHFVVGIGACAGSLEAMERLLGDLPAGTGMSFVLVPPPSPDHERVLIESLGCHTRLPLRRVQNDTVVEPDTIYVLPPRAEMIIAKGRLWLTERAAALGLFLPIDTFFCSLAEDMGSRSIAVMLSGTGSDGARGIVEIHQAGGLVIAQDPGSAKLGSMPRSASDTGVVEQVIPCESIAAALVGHGERMRHDALGSKSGAGSQETRHAAEAVVALLERESGIDFSSHKPATVARRVERRLLLSGATSMDEYIRKLDSEPAELAHLYCDLLIGITRFFRDREMFARLQQDLLPELVASLGDGEVLRIWVVACATGEEAYSMAMLAHEAFRQLERPPQLEIFATDVHQASLQAASAGVYSSASVVQVPEALRQRYFIARGDHHQVSPALRDSVVFARHDVLRDAPFTRMHLVSCRNLLIYFTSSVQRKTLAALQFGLQAGGIMVLGSSETLGPAAHELELIDARWKIYRRRRDARPSGGMQLGAPPTAVAHRHVHGSKPGSEPGSELDVGRAREPLAARYAPPASLLTEGLAQVPPFHGGGRYMVTLEPVEPGAAAAGSDGADLDLQAARERIEVLSLELRYTRATLQATLEEVEAGHEELQATNEELQATNEELHRTNDKLHRTNEELQSVNSEHQSKIAELVELTSDVNHLLEAAEVHTIFLDRELCVRRFTPMIAKTFHFVPEDVGRRFEHLSDRLIQHSELMADLHQVLVCERLVEREIRDHQGRDYLVRILPYRPHDRVDGVVVTLVDVSTLKQAQYELRLSAERYRTLMRAITSVLWTADPSGRFTTPQPEWAAYTGQSEQGYRDDGWLDAVHPQDRERFVSAWEATLVQRTLHDDELRVWSAAHRAYRRCELRAAPLLDEQHVVREWVGEILDVEDSKQAEIGLRTREAQLAGILQNSPSGIYIKNRQGLYILCSRVAAQAAGAPNVSWMLGSTDFDFLPHGVAEKRRAADRQVCRTREPLEVEEEIGQRDGTRKVLLSVRFPLFDDDGEVYAVAGVFSDITQRKLLEEREREEITRRDRFLAMMSHELRNPLGAILNAVHVLGHDGAGGEAQHNARAIIERQAQHMARLLDDLLDISRISQGKIDIRMSEMDLAQVVEAAADSARARAEHKLLDMQVHIRDTPLVVNGDPDRLEQVVSNLLLNAIKFTDREGRIWVELGRQDGEAVLVVRDTGIGLEAGEETDIFELFYQRDTSIDRAGGGLGVGLSLVRELITRHGGRIGAHSEGRGQGSVFTVVLPLAATREMMVTTHKQRQGGKPARMGISVVIVEDNDDSREMLELLLERRGHTVAAARDGRAGMALILERKPDLAFVDIGLPAMTGFDLAKQLRVVEPSLSTYMVALTGYGRREDREAVLAAGFDEHIVKPLKLNELERLITRLSALAPGAVAP